MEAAPKPLHEQELDNANLGHTEEVENVEAEETPRFPAHTDSMVSISLSNGPISPKSTLSLATFDLSPTHDTDLTTSPNFRSETHSIPFPSLAEAGTTESPQSILPSKLLRGVVDEDGDDAGDFSDAGSTHSGDLDASSSSSSRRSSATVEEIEALATELQRARTRSRNNSSASAISMKSLGSERSNPVDWAALEQNEENEEKGKATDEVGTAIQMQ